MNYVNNRLHRWFALTEMHLFIVIIIRMFELKQLDPIPPPVSDNIKRLVLDVHYYTPGMGKIVPRNVM